VTTDGNPASSNGVAKFIDPVIEVDPQVYSWSTTDVPKYQGFEKIGYTERQTVEDRVAQQAAQMHIDKHIHWGNKAVFQDGSQKTFTDHAFHRYLIQNGIHRERGTEWFRFGNDENYDPGVRSQALFFSFAHRDYSDVHSDETGAQTYVLRDEQRAAVEQAVQAFNNGETEVLWNAKPRFGKTLSTYDLILKLDARKVLIVTNRPAIANSWFDDFKKFIAHQTTHKFVSESDSLKQRVPMSRKEWLGWTPANIDDKKIIEFTSVQDLKGSIYFGGVYDKLRHIADFEWDLLVIDEAHEGVDTAIADVAIRQIKTKQTLHLSGTPFRALAKGKFHHLTQVYNWSYEDEQKAKLQWHDVQRTNPYEELPRLTMLTYRLSPMVAARLDEGAATDDDIDNIDFTFSLNEFFATKENGEFTYKNEVTKWLNSLTTNEKYPFSTKELRDEIRHSFWLLHRVDSAKALMRMLNSHPVFEQYDVVLAAGNGRLTDDDPASVGQSLERVRAAIADAEQRDGKTITLSVGQLTTGVTVPEWTAVMMLSDLQSPAQYMQAAFRAQNPWRYTRSGQVYTKDNNRNV
jgi:type II restriction enzyme